MSFSYSDVWDDTVRMFRAHASLIAAVAGVFIFLPALLTSYFLPQPQGEQQQMMANMIAYVQANAHWLMLGRLFGMVGTIAILLLLFRNGVTVGGAIGSAFSLVLFYFVTTLLSGLLVGLGLLLLLVPGLYLLGRLTPVGVVVVAEGQRNPIEALRRSFDLTRGRGWSVLGLVLLVAIAGFVAVAATVAVFGALFLLIAGQDIGGLLVLILNAFAGTILEVVLILLFAAIYRALVPARSGARSD
jgi:hypothetical protein